MRKHLRFVFAFSAILLVIALLPSMSASAGSAKSPYSSSLGVPAIGAAAPVPATCTNIGCQNTTTCGSSKPGWNCGLGPHGRCFEIAC